MLHNLAIIPIPSILNLPFSYEKKEKLNKHLKRMFRLLQESLLVKNIFSPLQFHFTPFDYEDKHKRKEKKLHRPIISFHVNFKLPEQFLRATKTH